MILVIIWVREKPCQIHPNQNWGGHHERSSGYQFQRGDSSRFGGEDTEASKMASIYQTVLSSEGSLYKRVACPLLNTQLKKQKISVCMTVLSSDSKIKAERMCCIFPGSVLEIQNKIKEIFVEEIFYV